MSVALSRRAFLRGSAAVSAGLCASLLFAESAAAVIFPGGQTAVIDNADGDPVRLRSTPNKTGDVRGNIGEGAVILITDGPKRASDGSSWYQVQFAGQGGWVMADYISARKLTGYAAVTFTDGDGVRLRDNTDTNAKMLGMVPEGAIVQIVEGPRVLQDGTPWYHVNHAGKHGYLMGTYLVPTELSASSSASNSKSTSSTATATTTATKTGEGTTTTKTTEADTAKAPDVKRDDRVKVANTDGGGVRMRDEVGYDTEILGTLEEGTVVTVIANITRDAKGNEWVPISFDGTKGYVMGLYLVKTNDALTKKKSLPTLPASTPTTATGSVSTTPVAAPESAPTATASGSKIVAEAMKYVGTRYVFGGTSPKGFDCSGFMMYSVQQAVGKRIPRTTFEQVGTGEYVSKDNLQAGDLVFFANTYAAGITHAGLYIGGGRFVHAENEGTGVVVSNMNTSYYASKYYSARRVS